MYFPTLVEVPIAQMFLSLGMHRGPLLAYLMADPELSLQSILIISTIIGRLKSWTYVAWVALFSTLAGLIYGAWVDGANVLWIGFYLALFLGALSSGLWWISRRNAGTLTAGAAARLAFSVQPSDAAAGTPLVACREPPWDGREWPVGAGGERAGRRADGGDAVPRAA